MKSLIVKVAIIGLVLGNVAHAANEKHVEAKDKVNVQGAAKNRVVTQHTTDVVNNLKERGAISGRVETSKLEDALQDTGRKYTAGVVENGVGKTESMNAHDLLYKVAKANPTGLKKQGLTVLVELLSEGQRAAKADAAVDAFILNFADVLTNSKATDAEVQSFVTKAQEAVEKLQSGKAQDLEEAIVMTEKEKQQLKDCVRG